MQNTERHIWFLFQSDGPSWSVPTGRRDGRISLSSQASNLPSPLDSIAVQRQKFAAKGLNDHDLVTLVGKTLFYYVPNDLSSQKYSVKTVLDHGQ